MQFNANWLQVRLNVFYVNLYNYFLASRVALVPNFENSSLVEKFIHFEFGFRL